MNNRCYYILLGAKLTPFQRYLALLKVKEDVLGILRCLERISSTLTVKIFNIGRKCPLWLGILRREVNSCL